jgi:hypothetical protein
MKAVERKRLEESLSRAKQTKVIRSRRPYDPVLGSWLKNAIAQHAAAPFHAIIVEKNPTHVADVIAVDEADENHPLMVSEHTWEVERVGATLAQAVGPLLKSAHTVLFVDRFFDIRDPRYKETLKACLEALSAGGANEAHWEIHFCDHDSRPPAEVIERDARRWLQGVLPLGTSITLFTWRERNGGADFHARYLLTDMGGISVDAGFSAMGAHQKVQLKGARRTLIAIRTVRDLVGTSSEHRPKKRLTRMLVKAPQSGTQNSASETHFRVRRPRPVVTAEYAPQTMGLRANALNCRRIVGVANPGPFAPTSWWSGGDSN